eukprot:jgi/Ulvmu1/6193/UM028_0049.1
MLSSASSQAMMRVYARLAAVEAHVAAAELSAQVHQRRDLQRAVHRAAGASKYDDGVFKQTDKRDVASPSFTDRLLETADNISDMPPHKHTDTSGLALVKAQEAALKSGSGRLITTAEEGFADRFSENLRNERIPVAAVSPASAVDWSGPWTWGMWAQFLVGPAVLYVIYSVVVSWHRWRYGYYHIHQVAEDLRSTDVFTRWTALDRISNMVQRPQWRRRATDAGVLLPLIDMLDPSILDVHVIQTDRLHQQQIAYNMLVQVLMTINWIMFDEEGEMILHQTGLHARLTEALDGPDAWIHWDLARAIARNIKFKLEDPPKRPVITKMFDRALPELHSLANEFPNLPSHWMHGDRVDDPSLGWRGDKIMQKTDAALEIPGARRRVQRWRSWWNKQEMYPPSVDRWLAQRRAFHRAERLHAQSFGGGWAREFQASTAAVHAGSWTHVQAHVWRGAWLLWAKPIDWYGRRGVGDG